MAEIDTKLSRLGGFLEHNGLDGVLLQQRGNFAWITGGRDNHIANNSTVGVTAILATREKRICLANTIETPRMRDEELIGTDIEIVSFPWWDSAATKRTVRDLIGGRKIAADTDALGLGLPALPEAFNALRWSLTDEEIARYRDGAARITKAMEDVCFDISPGDTEFEIAGVIDDYVHRTGANPLVTLVAVDERVMQFRHPIPTAKQLDLYAMLVTCAEFGGLISCLTRFVSFGVLSADIKRKHQAVCNVDAAVNLATRPGRTLGEIFGTLRQAYAANGFADEWQLHHQGGSTGYANREAVATPGSTVVVLENQPFAWNPSITGTKSEDTVLCTAGGIEVLTAASANWPKVVGEYQGQRLERAGILVR